MERIRDKELFKEKLKEYQKYLESEAKRFHKAMLDTESGKIETPKGIGMAAYYQGKADAYEHESKFIKYQLEKTES